MNGRKYIATNIFFRRLFSLKPTVSEAGGRRVAADTQSSFISRSALAKNKQSSKQTNAKDDCTGDICLPPSIIMAYVNAECLCNRCWGKK